MTAELDDEDDDRRFPQWKRGLKFDYNDEFNSDHWSLPSVEAWIEVITSPPLHIINMSLPSVEAWIEVLKQSLAINAISGRFPQWKRGLK